jgi:ribosomal protein L11 methyltransferase
VAPVRVITANIQVTVLAPLLPAMKDALTDDGEAILSGILVSEREEMLGILAAAGWAVARDDTEGDWWSVHVAPPRARSGNGR